MQQFIKNLRLFLRNHWPKILLSVFSAIVFLILIFPYDDLSDFVTLQVARATNNQVYLQFDQLSLQVFPQPSLAFGNMAIDAAGLPTMKAQKLAFSPSIAALLSFRPGFNIRAQGFLKGIADLTVKSAGRGEANQPKEQIELEIERLDIGELNKWLNLPISPKGQLSVNSEMVIDRSLSEQPEGELVIRIGQLTIPPSTVPTQMGPVSLPGFSWSSLILQGRLVGAKFIVEQGEFGNPEDPFRGQIRGQWDIRFENKGGQIQPNFGPYDFRIQLNLTPAVQRELGLMLVLVDNYKTQSSEGFQYLFRIQGTNTYAPPRFSSLSTFQ